MKWQWDLLIVPLIALGVWILGTLFKGEEDKAKKGTRRPGSASGRPPGRRPATDLDRFLEEARRRREEAERPKPPSPPRPTVSRPPLRERAAKPREAPRPTRPTLRSEEGPIAVPVADPIEKKPPLGELVSAIPVSPAAPSDLPPGSDLRRKTTLTPIAQQVRSLLSKSQTAGSAFALREIFDRPLCRRRRR